MWRMKAMTLFLKANRLLKFLMADDVGKNGEFFYVCLWWVQG